MGGGGKVGAGKGGGNILYFRQTVDLQASLQNHEIIYASKRGEKWEKIQKYLCRKTIEICSTKNNSSQLLTLRISKTNYWLRGFFLGSLIEKMR